MTYEQAYKDHSFLWSIGPADDMTGGYVDQEDLDKMLKTPTKSMARKCLCNQIDYWFQIGMDNFDFSGNFEKCCKLYPEILEIMKRHPQSWHW